MNRLMLILKLFWTFFKVGLFTFGGGYASIPLIENDVVNKLNWISYDEFTTFVGISEATPGPFAVNIATFIGSTKAGFLGSVAATLGFITPSFIIILLIAILLKKFMKSKPVRGFMKGVLPVVIGLIFASGTFILLRNSFGLDNNYVIDFRSLGIVLTILLLSVLYKKTMNKKLSPIIIVLISAAIGIIVY